MKRNKKASQKRISETPQPTPEGNKVRLSRLQELAEEYAQLPEYPDEPEEIKEKEPLTPTQFGKQLRQIQFIEAYIQSGGNVGISSKLAKVSRVQVWRWFKEEWFQQQINERMFEWEINLRAKMYQMAMNGNVTLLIFLSKFLNPFYDDVYRGKVLMGEMAQSLYERYPIPEPEFLPPAVPARFRDADGNNPSNEKGDKTI